MPEVTPTPGNGGKSTENRLVLTRPDDWHVHLRDEEMLTSVLPDTARRFARGMIMPNLDPPVHTLAEACAYRNRILAAAQSKGLSFEPLMTLYLTDHTTPEEIRRAKKSGFVYAVGEVFLTGATTNSAFGITGFARCEPVFSAMEETRLPLLLHGEVTDPEVDLFDRERLFIEQYLTPIVERFPGLKIVLEHITTREAVEFVCGAPDTVAATITAHHLLLNRNAMFVGGLSPHHYCLPVLKREHHRQALLAAAISGNSKFFLGSDSAPHPRPAKESACSCAGIYTAHAAIELYAEAFDEVMALDRLEAFASFHGPDFYGLPRNSDTITLEKRSWVVPEEMHLEKATIVPLRAGGTVAWRLVE
ncbi:dihydroorotase [Acidihalobacter aeolianus]|uniref:Dihydroorotase n=1 Tax=Acidihalobacter aeolianus TaxID=2792603 RepID=A0A1D8K7S2_9GAMM|nr:dihydroorotase [Acidihalobacter aeolianus]AOV17017.1 dihydroorotase [Acidihalobacter aeolianus]